MTDQELIEAVATGVMGWYKGMKPYVAQHLGCWWCKDNAVCRVSKWNPLESDADCMAAWDKFSDGPVYTCIENGWVSNQYHACYAADPNIEIRCDSSDRRRAMVACMAKAVSK